MRYFYERALCLFGRHRGRTLRIDKAQTLGIGISPGALGISSNYWIEVAHYECRRCGKYLGEWSPGERFTPVMTLEAHSFGFKDD